MKKTEDDIKKELVRDFEKITKGMPDIKPQRFRRIGKIAYFTIKPLSLKELIILICIVLIVFCLLFYLF